MRYFTLAGPAEIVRAKQKDDYYSDRLQKRWLDVLLKGSGTYLWLRLRTIPVGHFLYGAVTTLSGLQTLGEEYTGIVQVDSSQKEIPKFLNRLIMLILDSFGSVIIVSILNWIEKVVHKDTHLQPQAKQDISEAFKILKALLPFIERLHRTLLYCGGMYYHISKRVTGINYVLVRKWLKDYQSLYGFRLLGIITSVHLLGVAAHVTYKWIFSARISPTVIEEPNPVSLTVTKCPLCLEERKRVSATPCGHLFCWSCILEWLQTQNQCPICRERVEASRLILLQNYL